MAARSARRAERKSDTPWQRYDLTIMQRRAQSLPLRGHSVPRFYRSRYVSGALPVIRRSHH